MPVPSILGSASVLSQYGVPRPGNVVLDSSYDITNESSNQASSNQTNARTPSDLESSAARTDLRERGRLQLQRPDAAPVEQRPERPAPVAPEQPPARPDAPTGVLSGSLTRGQQDTLSSLSSALDKDTATLLNDLQSGTTLTDLAQQSGVDANALALMSQDGLLYDATL
ncbi:hypothetical protein [Kineosporia babensis]|uniref:Uncharacterized protein n=1 Tax=Kineosporia babensis TaxID=499548 RepID=A0A9X1NA20_9ACTN|nr:hypothetical protein [Kineosporia babensis]MCD5309486.1 hypothetical protein [Kineosporia babensis]